MAFLAAVLVLGFIVLGNLASWFALTQPQPLTDRIAHGAAACACYFFTGAFAYLTF